MEDQYAEVYNWDAHQHDEVDLPPRGNGRPHFSECLLFSAPDLYCTCDDDSPEWTI